MDDFTPAVLDHGSTDLETAVLDGLDKADDGTDATGFFNAEFFVPLKPFDAWPAGVN